MRTTTLDLMADLCICLVGLRFQLGALHLQNRHSVICATPPVYFGYFGDGGSHELFAQVNLKL
jgi:hypothetical protein